MSQYNDYNFRVSVAPGNGYSDENWTKLRSLLVDMRDSETDKNLDTPVLSTDQLQYLKHTGALQVCHLHSSLQADTDLDTPGWANHFPAKCHESNLSHTGDKGEVYR